MKGYKSNTTKVLEKRYENASPQIISTSLRTGWTTVIEVMFLINIHPWSAHTNIGEYASFLTFRRDQRKLISFLMTLNARYRARSIIMSDANSVQSGTGLL